MPGLHVETVHDAAIFLYEELSMFSFAIVFRSPLSQHNRYSILPAISLDGVLHLEVLDHAYSGEDFASFIRGLLDQMQPWPLPNSVIVMDNASIHKVPGIREMIEERCEVVFLLLAIIDPFFQWNAPYLSSRLLTRPESC